MVPYEIYKILHLSCIVIMISSFTLQFWGAGTKRWKIISGVASLLVLVSGMGLMARLGIKHGEPFPLWIYIKFGVWFLVGVGGAIVAKRLPSWHHRAYGLMIILFVIAAYAANYKF